MTLPTPEQIAISAMDYEFKVMSWNGETWKAKQGSECDVVTVAAEKAFRVVAKELREILFVPKIMTEKEKEEQVSKLVKLIEKLDGEKVKR